MKKEEGARPSMGSLCVGGHWGHCRPPWGSSHLVKFYCILELCVLDCWEWSRDTQKSEFHKLSLMKKFSIKEWIQDVSWSQQQDLTFSDKIILSGVVLSALKDLIFSEDDIDCTWYSKGRHTYLISSSGSSLFHLIFLNCWAHCWI